MEILHEKMIELFPNRSQNDCRIRIDKQTKQVSVLDVIRFITEFNSSDASTYLTELGKYNPQLRSKINSIRINGKDRETPVADANTIIEVIFLLPGQKANGIKRKFADYICKVLGGDLSLVSEIEKNNNYQSQEVKNFFLHGNEHSNDEDTHLVKKQKVEIKQSDELVALELQERQQLFALNLQERTNEIERKRQLNNYEMERKRKQDEQQDRIEQLKILKSLEEYLDPRDTAMIASLNDSIKTTVQHVISPPGIQINNFQANHVPMITDGNGAGILTEQKKQSLCKDFTFYLQEFGCKNITNDLLCRLGKYVKKKHVETYGEVTNLKGIRYCNGTNKYVNAYAIDKEDWLKEKIQEFLGNEQNVVKKNKKKTSMLQRTIPSYGEIKKIVRK